MVKFLVFDLCFLVVFIIGIVLLLVKNKKRTERDGIIFMFRTKLGIKFMDKFDKKHHKLISFLRYVIIAVGFMLMVTMVTLLIQSLIIYITNPTITDQVKAPPIAPLIPYFPELFGMKSYFPPFYFIYFILAIITVSICHEGFHGILMRYSKTKIKSTGMMFLGPILGFFVEQDDEDFRKKKRIDQMAALGAGVFANVLVFLLFFLLMLGFTEIFFQPSGYTFNTYSTAVLNSSYIDNITIEGDFAKIQVGDSFYFINSTNVELIEDNSLFYAYTDTPAFRNQVQGTIKRVDDFGVYSQESLSQVLLSYKPGDSAILGTEKDGQIFEYNITFSSHPDDPSKAYLGVGKYETQKTGIVLILSKIMLTLDEDEYNTIINKDVAYFIYYLLWWIMIVNLLVGLFNMLPWGILDGGRFLELAIGKFTGDEKAKTIVNITGKCILGIFVAMMVFWLFGITGIL